MLLRSIEITDFLSVKGSTKLLLDKTITVLLGSNDHGKSNLLKAIEHLNSDRPIKQDEVNWDSTGTASLDFTFKLTNPEREAWSEVVKKIRKELSESDADAAQVPDDAAAESEPAPIPDPALLAKPSATTVRADSDEGDDEETDDAARVRELRAFLAAVSDDVAPEELHLLRRGVETDLTCLGIDLGDLPLEIHDLVTDGLPRVELLRTLTGELQDSVSASQINTETFEFMQGLFFYAGLNPAQASAVFEQNDETERQIQDASKVLDENLRRLWGQGTHLHFSLGHRKGNIEFLADDPAIKKRKARMSKRSDGVTQFFRTSIVLHARRKKHTANSYLYLFDEPGVYLHPQGQKDLMQVFEQLGAESQIVYATHSLFMLNQNFPERHRLVIKDNDGTKIDGKPHRANWRLATDALGVFLTSNILFSSHVLFVEGDSDPLYLFELFRQMNRFGEIDADANRLGIMSFSDVQNLKFLLQVIKRDDSQIKVMVLFDGDEAGAKMSERVKSLCERLGVTRASLEKGKSIEDYFIHNECFMGALSRTLRDARELSGDKGKLPADFDDRVKVEWETRRSAQPPKASKIARDTAAATEVTASQSAVDKKVTPSVTAGRWFQEVAQKLIEDEASKVALARNYIMACREVDDSTLKQADYVSARKLCQQIAEGLSLPKLATEGPGGVGS